MSIKFKALLSAIALSGLGLIATQNAAHADNVTLRFSFGNNGHFHAPHVLPPHLRGHHVVPTPGYIRNTCSARRALRVARRDFDVRRAEIRRMNRQRIVVTGRRDHQRVRLIFANQRGCPVMSHQVRWVR